MAFSRSLRAAVAACSGEMFFLWWLNVTGAFPAIF